MLKTIAMMIEQQDAPVFGDDERRVGSLYSYSRRVPQVSLLSFLQQSPYSQRVYWESQRTPMAFAGYGVAAALYADGANRFDEIRAHLRHLFDGAVIDNGGAAELQPRLFGGFAFRDDFEPADIWAPFPSAYFVLPRYLLTQIDGRMWLTVNQFFGDNEHVSSIQQALYDEFARVSEQLTCLPDELSESNVQVRSVDFSLPQSAWRTQIEDGLERIHSGELEKVVLSRTCDILFDQPLDPINPLARLETRYPDTYRFLIEPTPGHAFFGATPELLVEVAGRSLRTAALAGSIRRGRTADENAALARELLASAKDRHEHALVADALREQLHPLTTRLDMPAEPRVMQLRNIQHLYTPIIGTLKTGYTLLDVVEQMHPTPALGGSPQREAVEAIRQIEMTPRGWYASPVGWIDAQGDGIFGVAIRSAVSAGDRARLYAGAGIVGDSDPDKEWAETTLKFTPMFAALGVDGDVSTQS